MKSIIAPVQVTPKQIEGMIYLVSLNKENYDCTDPYQVADIIETFIERILEAYYDA